MTPTPLHPHNNTRLCCNEKRECGGVVVWVGSVCGYHQPCFQQHLLLLQLLMLVVSNSLCSRLFLSSSNLSSLHFTSLHFTSFHGIHTRRFSNIAEMGASMGPHDHVCCSFHAGCEQSFHQRHS